MVGKMTEDKSGSDRWCIDNESDYVQHERKEPVMDSECRVLVPRASAVSLVQHDDEKGNEMGSQFYMLPFGIKPAVSMLIAFGVGACVLGASINEGMRGHGFAVETPVAGNSIASLWEQYPSVTESCVHALHQCETECYKEEMKCSQNKSQTSCGEKTTLCLGQEDAANSNQAKKQSCLALQQECERKALCFQGHQFCHVTGCFNEFMDAGDGVFQRGARMVWTEKAKAYDKCVHTGGVSMKGGAKLTGANIAQRRLDDTDAPAGCSHDMEKCLVVPWKTDLKSTQEVIETTVEKFKPSGYLEDSCGTQEAKCRAKCSATTFDVGSQLNLVAATVENSPLECESECAKIGSICSGFQTCSAAYQTCFFTKCAPQKGGPYKYDPDPTDEIPTWSFANDGTAYDECTNVCLRSLEICFQSVEWACKPDAKNLYCELPPSSSPTPVAPVTPK